MNKDLEHLTIAVLGGTGPQGRGLARRLAKAGLTVVLGSRTAGRARTAAEHLAESTGHIGVPQDRARAALIQHRQRDVPLALVVGGSMSSWGGLAVS